jgi:hypothetical protein
MYYWVKLQEEQITASKGTVISETRIWKNWKESALV